MTFNCHSAPQEIPILVWQSFFPSWFWLFYCTFRGVLTTRQYSCLWPQIDTQKAQVKKGWNAFSASATALRDFNSRLCFSSCSWILCEIKVNTVPLVWERTVNKYDLHTGRIEEEGWWCMKRPEYSGFPGSVLVQVCWGFAQYEHLKYNSAVQWKHIVFSDVMNWIWILIFWLLMVNNMYIIWHMYNDINIDKLFT